MGDKKIKSLFLIIAISCVVVLSSVFAATGLYIQKTNNVASLSTATTAETEQQTTTTDIASNTVNTSSSTLTSGENTRNYGEQEDD